jgi:hypothetical protein
VTRLDQLEFGLDVDPAGEASGHRAEAWVEAVDALDLLAPVVGDAAQPVGHDDALDDQRRVLQNDLADRLDVEVIPVNIDVTRFQRAGKGARQSPARGRDDIVQRRRARGKLVGADAVVLGDLGVNAEGHGLHLGREVSQPLGPTQALDPDPRGIGDLGHVGLLWFLAFHSGCPRDSQPRLYLRWYRLRPPPTPAARRAQRR